jgi:hypothetical protein
MSLVSRLSLTQMVSLLALTSGAVACTELEPAEVAIVSEVGRYRSEGFMRINAAPYRSDLDEQVEIDVWINAEAAADYAKVTPEASGSGVYLPDGTIIVREVHDSESGQLGKLTVMIKGQPGHAPEIGDWWFAVTDENGVPIVDETGRRLAGDLEQCYGCHQARAEDDFLFGVPSTQRPTPK